MVDLMHVQLKRRQKILRTHPNLDCRSAVLAVAATMMFAGAPGSAAVAALVTVNTAVGIGTGVQDTATGNTFLDFSAVADKTTFNQLQTLLSTTYAGFALATRSQIDTLFNDEVAASAGDRVAAFYGLQTAFHATLRDDSGQGTAFTFGAVDAGAAPLLTVQKIDGTFTSIGSPFLSTSHEVYAFSADISAQAVFPHSPFEGTVLPDVFSTGVLEPGFGFAADHQYFLDQGYDAPGSTPGMPLAKTTSGFWLVSVPATTVPEPASLMLMATGMAGLALTRLRRRS